MIRFYVSLLILIFFVASALPRAVSAQPYTSSENVTVHATVVSPGGGGGHGGGGGGGGGGAGEGGVFFVGRAYPLSKVNILKDGQLALTTIAGPDSLFSGNIGNLATGNYTFAAYGEDKNGLRSKPFTFQAYITSGATTSITGIFISPTIAVDKSQVKKGDNIAIFGQSSSFSQVVISVHSGEEYFHTVPSDSSGVYLYNFDSTPLDMGGHDTKSKTMKDDSTSEFGTIVPFTVGNLNIPVVTLGKLVKCDLNDDNRCNLIDFSIAAFWYKKPLSAAFAIKEKDHLNGDGKIDLIDFSIMAYYWTG